METLQKFGERSFRELKWSSAPEQHSTIRRLRRAYAKSIARCRAARITDEEHNRRKPKQGYDTMPNVKRDIASIVYSQLPAQIRDKLSVDLGGDPYGIRVDVFFRHEVKRFWRTELEDMPFEGMRLRCRVPDEFLARLCVEV